MQRLFSAFPGSWPGLGLLILRITVGAAPFGAIIDALPTLDAHAAWIAGSILGLLAACIVVGLGTPIATPLFAAGALVVGHAAEWPEWFATAGGSLSLTMIGPGAWSLDAWLYGRRRIDIDGQ